MTTARRQAFYFPDRVLKIMRAEADRLDRPISWIVQFAVKLALPRLREIPDSPRSDYAEVTVDEGEGES